MSRMKLLLALSLAGLLATGDAHAKKDDKGKKEEVGIQMTGVEAFDAVFGRIAEIDTRLATAEGLLRDGKVQLNTALGLKKNTALADGLAELKEVAGGKLEVAMNGKQPKLQATDAVPSNVQSAVDAVNTLTLDITSSIEELMAIPDETSKLVKQTQKFPDKLKTELEADLIGTLLQTPKIMKSLKNNATITAGLPKRSTTVVGRMNEMVTVVQKEFPISAGSPAAPGKGGPAGGRTHK